MGAPTVMQTGKLYVHATNIHQGGGKSLLWALVQALGQSASAVYLLDSRLPLPESMSERTQIKRVPPSALQRIKAERWLARNAASEDTVLCFGNLPPLFKLCGRAVVFVQNRYLIDDVPLRGFPLRVRLRLGLERLWFAGRMANADEFVVQTPTMKRLLEIKTEGRIPVRVLPFMAGRTGYVRSAVPPEAKKERKYDFVYVASGEPHKNHRRLLEAWCLLAEEGLFPSLCLTLDEARCASLCQEIEALKKRHGIQITNAGELPHQEALALYAQAGAAIYPSTFESFGLPLIEARQAGLQILASEMDYVRDVLDPEQAFDPGSALSIGRAVKRFMGKEEHALPLLDAKGFLERIMNHYGPRS